MSTLYFIVAGDPDTLTGGYIYDRRIVAQLQLLGWRLALRRLCASFPYPDSHALTQADETLAQLPDNALTIVDGLAFSAMPEIVHKHADRLRFIALIHHPLALETHLSQTQRSTFFNAEKQALKAARRVIVTSPATAQALQDYAVTSERLAVVPPGIDPVPFREKADTSFYKLLCVASLTARKGHRILIDALALLLDFPWQLHCIGSKTLAPDVAFAVCRQIRELKLEERITLIDALPQQALSSYYRDADLFVLASYYEGYGMVLAEALAHSLPLVTTRAGAIPDTVEGGAALLAEPGDKEALANCISAFFQDSGLRSKMRRAARQSSKRLPDWKQAGLAFAAQIRHVQTHNSSWL